MRVSDLIAELIRKDVCSITTSNEVLVKWEWEI